MGLTDKSTRPVCVAGVDGQLSTDPSLPHARADLGDESRPRVGARFLDVAAIVQLSRPDEQPSRGRESEQTQIVGREAYDGVVRGNANPRICGAEGIIEFSQRRGVEPDGEVVSTRLSV